MEFLEIAKTIADIGFLVILAAAVIYLLVKYFSAIIDMKVKTMQNSISNIYNSKKTNMIKHIAKLDALSPLKTLTRGYSIVQSNGKVVKSVNQIKKDDEIDIRLIDGKAKAKVM